jgi:hypothetical protein
MFLGGLIMANNNKKNTVQNKPRLSKRQRRVKVVVYIMIVAMLLSTFLAGAAMFL